MKYIEVKTLPINEDEVITLAMNANNLTAGLDYLESMALQKPARNRTTIRINSRYERIISKER